MAKVKVEFIESYIHGIDDEDGGSYIWNDNHGELIRCKNCKHGVGYMEDKVVCKHVMYERVMNPGDYCSYGEKEGGEEVVRCKDCMHRDPENHSCDCGCWHMPYKTKDDDYCSYGERREQG